jgi:hypothetical protein
MRGKRPKEKRGRKTKEGGRKVKRREEEKES